MSRTKWVVDGPDGTVVEVNGHKFGSNDDGAPMLCSMFCRDIGRHVHVDTCRSENPRGCRGAEFEHIARALHPNPEIPRDFISHALFWRRTGFKDPNTQEDREIFSKCDTMCAGPEHRSDANGTAQPSYCNLPIFHRPARQTDASADGIGYVSGEGHRFSCSNPARMQPAFHVIFVIDGSSSMSNTDRRPLRGTPVTQKISAIQNNRLGAVHSSLYGFWQARNAAFNTGSGVTITRRDAYSVILFNETPRLICNNDFASSPDGLLDHVLTYGTGWGTNFDGTLAFTQAHMESSWSTERAPVVIFLSDGEARVSSTVVRELCRKAIALGQPLSFHTVSFGPYNDRLQRMAQIALEVQTSVPQNPTSPGVPSSYTEALDTIRLAETFLGIAECLRKPRAALIR